MPKRANIAKNIHSAIFNQLQKGCKYEQKQIKEQLKQWIEVIDGTRDWYDVEEKPTLPK